MVPGMVVRVADKNVVGHAREEFLQSLGRSGEARPDDVGERFVRRVGGEALVQAEQGQRGNHGATSPSVLCRFPVEAPDQQHVLVHRPDEPRPAQRSARLVLSKAHGDELGLDDAVAVGR